MAKNRKQTVAVELRAPTGKLDRDMRKGAEIVRKRSRAAQRSLDRIKAQSAGPRAAGGGAMMRGGGRKMGGAIKGAVAFGGVYGLQQEVKQAKAFEEVLVDLAVRGKQSRKWLRDLRGGILKASSEFGIGKEAIGEYIGVIIDQTGNTELAVKTMRDMTAVAYSTNTNMGALAGTVVEMQSKLGLAPKQFIEAMGVLAAQADVGKVPLSKMATMLPEVLNSTVQFGHSGVGALREYGAVLQMAARGTGTLAEANTAMNRMLDQTAAKRGKIEKTLGIKLKKNGVWLSLAPMLKEIVGGLIKMKRAGKDVEKFIVQSWGIRGKKAILPLLQQGMIGFGNRVGSDAGGGGGLTSFNDLISAGDKGTIGKRVARKRTLSPELDAWNKSIERVKNNLHKHLLPALNALGAALPTIGKWLSFMVDNWQTLAVIWASGATRRFMASLITMSRGGGTGGYGGGGQWRGRAGGGGGGGGGGGKPRKGKLKAKAKKAGRGAGYIGMAIATGVEAWHLANLAGTTIGEFTDPGTKASQFFSSDEKWEKEEAAAIKARRSDLAGRSGFRIFKKLQRDYAVTMAGRKTLKGAVSARDKLSKALASGDKAAIKAALAAAKPSAKKLQEAEIGMIKGEGELHPVSEAGQRSRANMLKNVPASGQQLIFPEARTLILVMQAAVKELQKLDNIEKSIAHAAAKYLATITTVSRTKTKK